MKNREVAHAFAHDLGRDVSGSNLHYHQVSDVDGWSEIKSYRTTVAYKKGSIVVVTDYYYSSSTSTHLSYIRKACSHLEVIELPVPVRIGSIGAVGAIEEQLYSLYGSQLRAKKRDYSREINSALRAMRKYVDYCDVDKRKLTAAQKALIKCFTFEEAENLLSKGDEEKKRRSKLAKQRAKSEEKKRRAKFIKDYKIAKEKFMNRETSYVGSKPEYGCYDLIRNQGGVVYTSQGVRIKKREALVLQESLKRCAENPVAKTSSIGAIQGAYIDSDGKKLVKFGCHTFEYDYLVNFNVDTEEVAP
jgi:hypothetical protein